MTDIVPQVDFEALLNYIKQHRGFDFTGYKRSSLTRRINKRMQAVGIEGYVNYQDYLEVHPEEFGLLFNTLLINVTSFFRDTVAWEHIERDVIPQIIAQKSSNEAIRIWSAGCASGEEAYTIAIILAETLGIEQFQKQVKIYATDVDEEALAQARQATYSANNLATLSPQQVEQFFEQNDNGYTFRKDLRRSVIFGRHDLIQDAPISRIDLLICRNVIMYFDAETQSRVLKRFHFALRNQGFLFLGKSETLLSNSKILTPVHLKCRIFTSIPGKLNWREQELVTSPMEKEEALSLLSDQLRLQEAAFEQGSIAQIVVDPIEILALVNERAKALFNLRTQDLGRPLQDLDISYRPVELRSCIDRAYSDRRTITLRDIEWQPLQGEKLHLEVQVSPLIDTGGKLLGCSISFINVTHVKRLQEDLENSTQELEMAYEELQSANEELETTNEELQSANEELETTNEELQSTNEELETMNEELQSTNEELHTVNEELQRRSEQLNSNNAFLESILISLKAGVVVVDWDLYVQVWSSKAEDLWGLRPKEAIGQNFLNLDIGLPVDQLRQPIRDCLVSSGSNHASEVLLDATNRRGRSIRCRVVCTPLMDGQGQIHGVILLMEEYIEEALVSP